LKQRGYELRGTFRIIFNATGCVLQKGVFVAGLREEIVDSVEQVLGLLEAGEGNSAFSLSLFTFISLCGRVMKLHEENYHLLVLSLETFCP
jgi:hypothetical protein